MKADGSLRKSDGAIQRVAHVFGIVRRRTRTNRGEDECRTNWEFPICHTNQVSQAVKIVTLSLRFKNFGLGRLKWE